MKVLIQNAHNQQFLGEGRWVNNAAEAENFRFTSNAYAVAKRHVCGLFNVIHYLPEDDLSLVIVSGSGSEI